MTQSWRPPAPRDYGEGGRRRPKKQQKLWTICCLNSLYTTKHSNPFNINSLRSLVKFCLNPLIFKGIRQILKILSQSFVVYSGLNYTRARHLRTGLYANPEFRSACFGSPGSTLIRLKKMHPVLLFLHVFCLTNHVSATTCSLLRLSHNKFL